MNHAHIDFVLCLNKRNLNNNDSNEALNPAIGTAWHGHLDIIHASSGFLNVLVACLALFVCPSTASEAQCIPEATETNTLDELTLTLTATDIDIVINDAAKGT